jgi:hypothetical protein
MSLRDKALTVIGTDTAKKGGSLRVVTPVAIAKPDGRAVAALNTAASVGESRKGRIGFLLDATGSRSEAWLEAQTIQRRMFDKIAGIGKMALRLVYFGGNNPPSDQGWMNDSSVVARRMADVTCIGGQTQIISGLNAYVRDNAADRAQSVLMIGDSFEESEKEALIVAKHLKQQGTKVFTCQEGRDPTAAHVFKQIAEITGGRYFPLGGALPLDEICENVAIMTIGGQNALKRLGTGRSAQQLLLGSESGPAAPKP